MQQRPSETVADDAPPPAVHLAEIFLAHVPKERHADFAAQSGLGEALAQLAALGSQTWRDIPLAATDFAAYLGRGLPAMSVADLALLRGDDLWLACAYGRGIPGAAEALEKYAFASIVKTLLRLDSSEATIADILQELRRRLVEQQTPQLEQKVYMGRGSLIGWLRVSAVREMHARKNRRARELPLGTGSTLLAAPVYEPEVALLLKTHKQELGEAFQRALAAMSSRDRNVLRYHFVEHLNIDQIGALYGVHRTTAARWIERAREILSTQTRTIFQERISISNDEFQRVVMLIQSQIEVQLAAAVS